MTGSGRSQLECKVGMRLCECCLEIHLFFPNCGLDLTKEVGVKRFQSSIHKKGKDRTFEIEKVLS